MRFYTNSMFNKVMLDFESVSIPYMCMNSHIAWIHRHARAADNIITLLDGFKSRFNAGGQASPTRYRIFNN